MVVNHEETSVESGGNLYGEIADSGIINDNNYGGSDYQRNSPTIGDSDYDFRPADNRFE